MYRKAKEQHQHTNQINTMPQDETQEITLVNEKKLHESGIERLPKSLKTYGLNFKQIKWADYYFISMNATDAYKRSYGVDQTTAENGGSRLLRHPKVRLYLQEKLKKRQAKSIVTLNKIENEYSKIAFSSLYDMFEEAETGQLQLKRGEKLSEEQKAAMQSIQLTKNRDGSISVKFKLYNKLDALNSLARMKGGFKDNPAVQGGKSFDEAVKERKERKMRDKTAKDLRKRGEIDRRL